MYCHKNKINGKRYIGMTSQSPNERFRNGNGYKSSPHFFHAIQKYGWNNFDHMILAQNLSKDEAIRKEIEIIALYRSNDAKFGYNITPGGEVCAGEDNPWFGKKHTAESKEKMSRAKKGVPKSEEWRRKISNSNKGKIVSDQTKEKMRKSHADVSGKNNPMYGKRLSKEHIEKMVAASKTEKAIEKMKKNKIWHEGKNNPNAKRVICIETQKIYDTVNDAAADNGCNPTKVSAVCHGKRNHTKNLHFEFIRKERNFE